MQEPPNLRDSKLSKFIRVVGKQDPLFQQGDWGNTMFLILEGSLHLYEKINGSDQRTGILGPGDVIGERALLAEQRYRRPYTAVAEQETAVLEIEPKQLEFIESIVPDFVLKILRSNVIKLDRANELIRVLRTIHPIERFIHYLIFFIRYYGNKTSQGVEFQLSPEDIWIAAALDKEMVFDCFQELLNRKVIIQKGKYYVISDENAVRQLLSHLKERVAV